MSGVFGVIDPEHADAVDALLARMVTVLRHRSWYVADAFTDTPNGAGLGRVGIGVFNRERQPLRSDHGRIVVCFSGELNDAEPLWQELERDGVTPRERSDCELVLRLYERRGQRFIHRIAGVFVTAIWDSTTAQLVIANDRFGLCPLYYAHHRQRLLFAPEMKAILCAEDFDCVLDPMALADSVRFQHVLGDKTFFAGVSLLPNASVLCYDARANRLTVESYWDVGKLAPAPHSLTLDEAAEEAGRLLADAVRRCVAGPFPVGLQLSGGVDARALLGLVRHHVSPVTVTFGQPNCGDVVYAERLARLAGAQHHSLPFHDGAWVRQFADLHLEMTEGEHSWIHAHGISTLETQRALFEVNLSGYGGGERSFTEPAALLEAPDDDAFLTQMFHELTQTITWPGLDEGEARMLFSPPARTTLSDLAFDSLRRELAAYRHLPPTRRALAFCLHNSDRRLYGQFLVFSRSHVEQRVPFCDYRYTEFVYSLPPGMLVDRRLRFVLLQQRMPDLAAVPYAGDGLPPTSSVGRRTVARILQRGKRFVNSRLRPIFPEHAALSADYEGWLRHELREWGHDLLLSERARRRGWFNQECVQSLWCRLQSGREPDFIGKLASLMTWEMLQRRFCDPD